MDKSLRKKFLEAIVNRILSGNFLHSKKDFDKLYSVNESTRKQYQDSAEWNGPSWGYDTNGKIINKVEDT